MPDLPSPQSAVPWLARLQSAADAAGVERRHLAVGAVTFVVLVVVVGALALGAGRSSAHPQVTLPRAPHTGDTTGSANRTDSTDGTGDTTGTADAQQVVAAAGAVGSPGLYKL